MIKLNFENLIKKYITPETEALILIGSYARGDFIEYSDVDLMRLVKNKKNSSETGTVFFDGHFIVINDYDSKDVESWFCEPQTVVKIISGLQKAEHIWDPNNIFTAIKKRALDFTWTNELQQKANEYAVNEMIGWIEEARKGMAGLKTGDYGRLLNARFGLSWGLTGVMQVLKGILTTGDNTWHSEVFNSIGENSQWVKKAKIVFGITPGFKLNEQVKTGLELYLMTINEINEIIKPKDKSLIENVTKEIRNFISGEIL